MFRRLAAPSIVTVLVLSIAACSGLSSTISHGPSSAPNGVVPSHGMQAHAGPSASNTWSFGANAPIRQFTGAATSIGSDIYLLGGENHTTAFNENDVYDTVANTWTKARRMPTARLSLAAAAVNGLVYAIGGETFTGTPLSTVEAYDPISN